MLMLKLLVLRVVDALLLHDRVKREPETLHSKVNYVLFLGPVSGIEVPRAIRDE